MRAIMVMFDSLNKRMLSPYGCEWVHTPNFQRLSQMAVSFDNCYVGSMPCMPARRELHTGRYNFLHRSWGPLEPFDDSMPEILKKHGIYTHLTSDHTHYWEDGGSTYHTRYSSWEISRGQEGDPWKAELKRPGLEGLIGRRDKFRQQDIINRKHMPRVEDQPQHKTFENGLEFIKTNHKEQNWFLHIETFDPHEPFFTQKKYKSLYPHDYNGPEFDWPEYKEADEKPEQVQHCRYEYAALVSMCDEYLGKVLDLMDEFDLWQDTMLIVNTDHGFLLGEHEWWAKCVQPFYNEVVQTPLFIWDPRSGIKGKRCDSLVQTIDLAPTLLDFFGIKPARDMQGIPLKEAISSNKHVRDAALFGLHGCHVNCTDGRYVYMRAPVNENNEPIYNYTLMPTHMRGHFKIEELKSAEFTEGFSFTKGCRVLKTNAGAWNKMDYKRYKTMLFDLEKDPGQLNPIEDNEIEFKMIKHMIRLMKENDAPVEQFERLGLTEGKIYEQYC